MSALDQVNDLKLKALRIQYVTDMLNSMEPIFTM